MQILWKASLIVIIKLAAFYLVIFKSKKRKFDLVLFVILGDSSLDFNSLGGEEHGFGGSQSIG
jgi:hypothetical protein